MAFSSFARSENCAASLVVLWTVAVVSSALLGFGLGTSDDAEFAPQVVSLDMVEALAHICSLLQVDPSCGVLVLGDQGELLRAAQAASERIHGFDWVS